MINHDKAMEFYGFLVDHRGFLVDPTKCPAPPWSSSQFRPAGPWVICWMKNPKTSVLTFQKWRICGSPMFNMLLKIWKSLEIFWTSLEIFGNPFEILWNMDSPSTGTTFLKPIPSTLGHLENCWCRAARKSFQMLSGSMARVASQKAVIWCHALRKHPGANCKYVSSVQLCKLGVKTNSCFHVSSLHWYHDHVWNVVPTQHQSHQSPPLRSFESLGSLACSPNDQTRTFAQVWKIPKF